VTGGAGFIGSALVHALNKSGRDDIVVADFLGSDEKYKNLLSLRIADYLEADKLLSLAEKNSAYFDQFETIFHLGACSSTTERDAGYLIQNNYEYSKVLAGTALSRGIRFLYASSAATYGDGSKGMDDQVEDLNQFLPLNMYAYSKQLFDLYARRNKWFDHIVGLKYFNVFGPNESHKGDMRSLVAKSYDQIQESGEICLFKSYNPNYGDGDQMRDFLYIKDAVAMTLHLASDQNATGIFNLGSGVATSWNTLAKSVFHSLDLEPNIRYIDMPDSLKGKYQYYTLANIEKLRRLGYGNTGFTIQEAVDDYMKNYLTRNQHLG